MFTKHKGVLWVGVAACSGVAAVALFPPFKETRKGFHVAVSAERPAVSPFWSWVLGPMGGAAAFMGSTANVVKIGADYPILAGLRTPISLSGGVVGCYLTFYLTPIIMDGARCLSHVVAFSIDGMVADVVGRPQGQPPAWETSRMWGWEGPAEHATPEAKELDQRMRQTLNFEEARTPSTSTEDTRNNVAVEDEETQEEIRWMCAELMRLRTQERALKQIMRQIGRAEGAEVLLADKGEELRVVRDRKKTLKDAARNRYHMSLGKRTDGELMGGVAKLQALRYRQLALGDELYHGVRSERRAAIDAEIRQLDTAKDRLKKQFRREFGVILARRTKQVQRWKDAATRGIQTSRNY